MNYYKVITKTGLLFYKTKHHSDMLNFCEAFNLIIESWHTTPTTEKEFGSIKVYNGVYQVFPINLIAKQEAKCKQS